MWWRATSSLSRLRAAPGVDAKCRLAMRAVSTGFISPGNGRRDPMSAVPPPRGPAAPGSRMRPGPRKEWSLCLPAPAPYRGILPSSPARALPSCATWIAKASAPAASNSNRNPASPRRPEYLVQHRATLGRSADLHFEFRRTAAQMEQDRAQLDGLRPRPEDEQDLVHGPFECKSPKARTYLRICEGSAATEMGYCDDVICGGR